MAAVAPAQVNGLGAPPSIPASPDSSTSSTKRKRDATDDAPTVQKANGIDGVPPAVNGNQPRQRDEKELIRDFHEVLRRHDPKPSILARPIATDATSDEPQAKRQKAEDDASSTPAPTGTNTTTIDDKVSNDRYATLDDIVADIKRVVNDAISELQSSISEENAEARDGAIAQAHAFRKQALELYRREIAYPAVVGALPSSGLSGEQPEGRFALSVYGLGPQPKTLYTNLQLPVRTSNRSEGVFKDLSSARLPPGVIATKVMPYTPTSKKSAQAPTLGQLFPPAANLPTLQAPKTAKTTTKGNMLGFYHPDPIEKCSYRAGHTYFSQPVSVGQWVDYTNATPSSHSHVKTRQRERAQSLAGHKPSSVELEMSEMETLFRRAFTSFAPSKDDSSAVVSSTQAGRIWWQRVGQRQYQRMIEADESSDGTPDEHAEEEQLADDIDEDIVKEAISNWEELIDPSLEETTANTETDKAQSIDDKLAKASDLIETLASYQRNRNLTLPTSKNRRSTEPVNVDLLHGGSLIVQQPGDEEMEAYVALKNHLLDIILELPPYAVSRLDGDKLGDLFISTKIEIRTDVRPGVNEEDEAAVKARQKQQQQQMVQQAQQQQQRQQVAQASASSSRQPHRTPSMSAGVPYSNQQQGYFANQNRPPVPNTAPPPYYQPSPGQALPQPMHQRPPMPGGMQPQMPQHQPHPQQSPHPQMQQHPQHRPTPPQQYRQPNGYQPGYAQQLAKSQTPYGHTNMQYPGTPGQPSPQRLPHGYAPGAPVGTPTQPQHRFPGSGQGYTPGYPMQQHQQAPQHHQQQMYQHQQQPHHPQHPGQRQGYPQYTNGAANMPPRPPQPQMGVAQQHAYGQTQQHHPQPQQHAPQMQGQPRYQPYAPSAPSPMTPSQGQRYSMTPGGGGMQPNGTSQGMSPSLGPSGFYTHMTDTQQSQLVEQSQAQAALQAQVRRSVQQQQAGALNDKLMQGGGGVGANAGLAGIGLKGNFDVQKQLAAVAANRALGQAGPGHVGMMGQMTPGAGPRPQVPSPAGVVGTPGGASPSMNGIPMQPHQRQQMSASPAGFSHASPSPVPVPIPGGAQSRPQS
ncbi:hypothetical protein MAPG_04072 [Magnaporthiopsis poae ATCC 64411]|uniref:Uncharacterized protein n=1 Tax=Magnaporthiopsis poae (strain ATCC 64411 / 73-15) TaxID=644358 RepID=A0A0C4DVR1_MAGP6|nr:hypothetical protein MAPG_04072 [Magnaporthiopsis poae ATCC 64411]